MLDLLDEILSRLRNGGVREVYPSFDAVPFSRKSKECVTIVSTESVQLEAPFPDGDAGVYPFTAVYRVSVLIPTDLPLRRAEDLFYETIVPQMESFGSVLCEAKTAHVDAVLGRVVMEGRFRLRGLWLGEVSA